jgi:hypothetical protein
LRMTLWITNMIYLLIITFVFVLTLAFNIEHDKFVIVSNTIYKENFIFVFF